MKIEFLTQEDSLYVLPFFEEFLRHYASEFEISRISCCGVRLRPPKCAVASSRLLPGHG